jgi:hypothetical protein
MLELLPDQLKMVRGEQQNNLVVMDRPIVSWTVVVVEQSVVDSEARPGLVMLSSKK